jgi:hypothetical protein
MNYQEFVTQNFIPRANGAWNGMKNNLIVAGLPSNAVTIEEVTTEGVNDLRYRIIAKRGNKTVTGYIELTNAGIQNGAMMIAVTLYIDNNGTTIPTSYVVGAPVPYNSEEGLLALLQKLTNIENLASTELITAIRAALGL